MRYRFNSLLTIALLLVSTAHAEMITHQLANETSETLESLGRKFIIGCAVLALGMIGSAFVSRKK